MPRQSNRIPRVCETCGAAFSVFPCVLSAPGGGKYCSKACQHESLIVPLEERFWRHVQKTDTCWVWAGATVRGGYAQLRAEGVIHMAHRLSWEIHRGPIPDGQLVLHNCPGRHNARCVNPDHLKLGDHLENAADRNSQGLTRRGEAIHNAVLTPEAVAEIRRRYVPRKVSERRLAREFGVSQITIHRIICGKIWKHLL